MEANERAVDPVGEWWRVDGVGRRRKAVWVVLALSDGFRTKKETGERERAGCGGGKAAAPGGGLLEIGVGEKRRANFTIGHFSLTKVFI